MNYIIVGSFELLKISRRRMRLSNPEKGPGFHIIGITRYTGTKRSRANIAAFGFKKIVGAYRDFRKALRHRYLFGIVFERWHCEKKLYSGYGLTIFQLISSIIF